MAGLTGQLLDGVAQGRKDRGQRLAGAAFAPRQVQDQCPPAHAGQAAGERGHRRRGNPRAPHLFGKAGYRVVDLQRGCLGSHVAGREARAARCDDEVAARLPEERSDLVKVIRDDLAATHLGAGGLQQRGHGRPAAILGLAGGAAVTDRYHPGGRRFQTPLLPPLFSSRRTASSQTPGSRPLTMSMTVRPATAAAVRASISTPVRPVTRAVARIRPPSSTSSKSTATLVIGSGWQSGMSSAVRLAAMIPATRATPRASPLASSESRIARSVSGAILTRHSAVASRRVSALAPPSTIRAAPDSSRWVRREDTTLCVPQMRTQAVLLDSGLTLVTFEFPTAGLLEVLEKSMPWLGPDPPTAEWLLFHVLHPLEADLDAFGSDDEVDYLALYERAWRRAGLSVGSEVLFRILDLEQQCWDRAVSLAPNALAVLDRLRASGRRTGICSNAPFPAEMMLRQLTAVGIAEGM